MTRPGVCLTGCIRLVVSGGHACHRDLHHHPWCHHAPHYATHLINSHRHVYPLTHGLAYSLIMKETKRIIKMIQVFLMEQVRGVAQRCPHQIYLVTLACVECFHYSFH